MEGINVYIFCSPKQHLSNEINLFIICIYATLLYVQVSEKHIIKLSLNILNVHIINYSLPTRKGLCVGGCVCILLRHLVF